MFLLPVFLSFSVQNLRHAIIVSKLLLRCVWPYWFFQKDLQFIGHLYSLWYLPMLILIHHSLGTASLVYCRHPMQYFFHIIQIRTHWNPLKTMRKELRLAYSAQQAMWNEIKAESLTHREYPHVGKHRKLVVHKDPVTLDELRLNNSCHRNL